MNALAIVLIVALGAAAGLATYNVLAKVFAPTGRAAIIAAEQKAQREQEREKERRQAVTKLGDVALRLVPMAKDSQKTLATRISSAGWSTTTGAFLGYTVISIVMGVAIGIALTFTVSAKTMAMHIALLVLPVAIGAALPWVSMASAIRRRRKRIERTLPNVLELLSIVVSAGQTIDTGIKTVADRTAGPIADEFRQVSNDVTFYGKTTIEALEAMDERCSTRGVSLFVASVKQAMQVGAPMKENLRIQAAAASDRFFKDLEEETNKIRTKMIIPMVLFILPPIFIVAIGPAVMNLLAIIPNFT